MHHTFEGKVALITGAGEGIGFEIAKQLAGAGAKIMLNDIEERKAFQAVEMLNTGGQNVVPIAGDASDLHCIQRMVEAANLAFGRLDMVVANAGVTTYGSFLDYSVQSFEKLVAVNLQGSFFLAQRAAKLMIQNQTPGRILFMSSVTGHQAHPNLAAYGMTKAALEMLAKSLAVELGPYKITVNAVAPGATLTERTTGSSDDYQKTWERITPTGKVCTTLDIAHAAMFLLSDASAQITGQSLVVDGGWTSVSPPP